MKRFFISFGLLLLVGCVASVIVLFSVYKWAVSDLPNFTRLADYRPPQATTVLARDGSLIGLLYSEKRFMVSLDEMSPWMPKALMAVEDSEFYNHAGVDPLAIVRAFLANLKSGRHTQGGSTITQQVIKRLLLSPERTYERKIKEAILAYRLEKYLTKDEILTIYLNQSFLGANAYGVEAAARTYFGKHAKELTLAECALLAGLPQAPTAYNPYKHPEAARARQLHVLNRLKELGWITEDEFLAAKAQPLEYRSMDEGMGREGAWYLEEVRRELIDLFSEDNARARGWELPCYGEQAVYELGLTVRTGMEPMAQRAADEALRNGLEATDKRHGWRGPLEKLDEAGMAAFIETSSFKPEDLADNAWVKAVVTQVNKGQAKVRMGRYSGVITTANMSWARKPNPKVSARYAAAVKDARGVLAVGDVIWVSAAVTTDAKTKKSVPYDPAAVTPEHAIALRLQQYPLVQGALVSVEPQNGDVIAMIGGYNFYDSQFNRATQAHRQPGSSFKPVVYSAALDAGMTPVSIVMDAPVVVVDQATSAMWRPGNIERNFRGPLTLRTALALSRNLCSIRLAQQIGVEKVVQRAKDLGLEGEYPPVLSISLGSVEVAPINLAEAYTAFAGGGVRVKPRLIWEIRDSDGTLLHAPEPVYTQAISAQNAYLMSYMLKQVVQGGTGARAQVLGRPLGGKTGTSNEERDAWFMGMTPSLVTAVYVGYDQSRPMGRHETGSTAALPIFVDYAKVAFEAYPPDDFPVPTGIVTASVNKETGTAASPGAKGSIVVPFYEGTGPNGSAQDSDAEVSRQGEDLLRNLY